MAKNAVYCCQIFTEASGKPSDFIRRLFPEPAQDLLSYDNERSLLEMELDMIGACEHYRNQSVKAHRDACNYMLAADIKMAQFLGLSIADYQDILTDPNT